MRCSDKPATLHRVAGLLSGLCQTVVQRRNVLIQIGWQGLAFVLQDVARVVERDNPVEEALLFVESSYIRFVLATQTYRYALVGAEL